MGRRACETEAVHSPEPSRKRNKSTPETCEADYSFDINQPLPSGEILTDATQKQWRIGKPIGCGSFGEIYLASDDTSCDVTLQNARYVLKVEPHTNGPLFVEVHCLIRTARHAMIQQWCNEKKIQSLGMPHFIANGSHTFGDARLRFLVLPRYQQDLQKLSMSLNAGRIQPKNILVLATQIISVLEYLHSHGYTHSDIKSSNLMIGNNGNLFKRQKTQNEAPAIFKVPRRKIDMKGKPPRDKYYEDDDFIVKDHYPGTVRGDNFRTMENLKKAKRYQRVPIKLTSSSNKNFRAQLFNLRKLNASINYEDLNSSICSDNSYQTMLDDSVMSSDASFDEGFHDQTTSPKNSLDNFEVDPDIAEAITSQSPGQIYLLDFGLASKFVNSNGTHKEFGMDQRKAHDGTLEYSSRDSHIGAHSRRSDLENLGYNILDWLTGTLPWKTQEMLADPDLVHALKKSCMKDVKGLLETCFKTQAYPQFLEKYFLYVTNLEFTEEPDYAYCRSLFVNEFKECGYGTEQEMMLNFSNADQTPRKKINYSKKINNRFTKNTTPEFLKRNGITKVNDRENHILNSLENDLKLRLIREGLNCSNDGQRKPCVSRNFYVSDALLMTKLRQTLLPALETPSKKFSPKNLRSKKVGGKKKKKKGAKNGKSSIGKFGNFLGSGKQFTWAEILAGNPEDIIRKTDKDKGNSDLCDKRPRSRKVSNASEISAPDVNASPNLLRKDFLHKKNPTYAMKEIVENYRKKIHGKKVSETDFSDGNENGYTPAMVRVMLNREKFLKQEKQLQERENRKQSKIIASCKVVKKNSKDVCKPKSEVVPMALRRLLGSPIKIKAAKKNVTNKQADKTSARKVRRNLNEDMEDSNEDRFMLPKFKIRKVDSVKAEEKVVPKVSRAKASRCVKNEALKKTIGRGLGKVAGTSNLTKQCETKLQVVVKNVIVKPPVQVKAKKPPVKVPAKVISKVTSPPVRNTRKNVKSADLKPEVAVKTVKSAKKPVETSPKLTRSTVRVIPTRSRVIRKQVK